MPGSGGSAGADRDEGGSASSSDTGCSASALLQLEVDRLTAALRATVAAQAASSTASGEQISRELAAQFLVQYEVGGRSRDVLAIFASILGCGDEQAEQGQWRPG